MVTVSARTRAARPRDFVDRINLYEAGRLDDDSTIELFQYLVDSGLAWTFQGSYGRTAQNLIEGGFITPKEEN